MNKIQPVIMKRPEKPLTLEDTKQLEADLVYLQPGSRPLTLARLHGFLCATVSGPTFVKMEVWTQWLFSAYTFTDANFIHPTMERMVKLYMRIHEALQKKEQITPLLSTQETLVSNPAATDQLLTDWSYGYIEAVRLNQRNWFNPQHSNEKVIRDMLFPAYFIAGIFDHITLDEERSSDSPPTRQQIRERSIRALPEMIATTYAYWRTRIVANKLDREADRIN